MRPGPNGPETENQEIAIRGISVKNVGRDVQVAIRSTFCAGRISALHGRDSSATLHENGISRARNPLLPTAKVFMIALAAEQERQQSIHRVASTVMGRSSG
jgi:hypothetical protein